MKNKRTILVVLILLATIATVAQARELGPKVSFGAQRIGATFNKAVTIDLRVPGGQNFTVVAPKEFSHPFRVEPGTGPDGAYEIKNQQFVELRMSFHPTDDRDYEDTLILVRPTGGNIVDKVVVTVSGRGVRQAVKVIPVDFSKDDSTIYIGDSIFVKRRAPFEKGDARRFRLVDSLNPPFHLVVSPQVEGPLEEVILGASFAPRVPGTFRDKLVFERIDSIPNVQKPVVLDTLVYEFVGVAKQQLDKVELTFNAFAKDPPSTKTGSFVVESANDYDYVGSALTNGPCAFASVKSTFTKELYKVEYTVSCTPTKVGQFVDTLVIKRFNATKELVDQTLVICTTIVRPRPLKLSVSVTPGTTAAKIGDTVSLAVVATADHVPDLPAQVSSASFVFSYNASVLIPLTTSTVTTGRNGDISTVTLTRTQQDQLQLITGIDTIGVLRFVVALGTAESDVVRPLEGTLITEQVEVKSYELNSASITITDIWEHGGGPRLVNSLRGPCDITVDPNPLRTTAVMRLVNVPKDVGTFHIVNTSGVVVKDFSLEVQKGVREFTLNVGSGDGLALSPGTYYARLFVGANGKTVYSVVRMIVVE